MYATIYNNIPTVVENISKQDIRACNMGLILIVDLKYNKEFVAGTWTPIETIDFKDYECG